MPPKDGKTIEPINSEFDKVTEKIVNPITKKSSNNKALLPVPGENPITPIQEVLNLQIDKQIEIDGVGMGVLNDGTP